LGIFGVNGDAVTIYTKKRYGEDRTGYLYIYDNETLVFYTQRSVDRFIKRLLSLKKKLPA
jgi:phage tail sheath gpL-like